MKDKFEISLLESGEFVKKGATALINNAGRAIAVITLVISALILFTDIGFSGFYAKTFTSTLTVTLIASYLMYFSMEDAGEKLGEESEEYKRASERCKSLAGRISGDMISELRLFCKNYADEELKYRKISLLMHYGYGEEEYERYLSGGGTDKRAKRAFRRADRLKPAALTPRALLCGEGKALKNELINPERSKIFCMLLRLLPTTVCMTVTVSVILTTKENLGAA
ncbi:MAG: hypothetical protein IKV20_04165, partial [Clostridia bacterium]|nr:hypothetical protein [Clostridia bacterium]